MEFRKKSTKISVLEKEEEENNSRKEIIIHFIIIYFVLPPKQTIDKGETPQVMITPIHSYSIL